MDRLGPKHFPVNPFEPPRPSTMASAQSNESNGQSNKNNETYEKPLPGWQSANALASKMGGAILVKKTAERYRESHPDWFKISFSKRKSVEYYHPSLIKLLEEDLHDEIQRRIRIKEAQVGFENPPAGWRTAITIARLCLLGTANPVEAAAEEFRSQHPDWFKFFKAKSKTGYSEYYHPELVNKLQTVFEAQKTEKEEEIQKRGQGEKPPTGWKSATSLTQEFGRPAMIKRTAEKYRADHPEWFGVFWSRSGPRGVYEYYHPHLVEKLRNDLQEARIAKERYTKERALAEFAPVGWKTASSLSKVHGFRFTIESIAERYRDQHPEWFKLYWSKTGAKEIEHYHPELVDEILRQLKNLSLEKKEAVLPPEGWHTPGSLIWKGVSRTWIEMEANKLITDHPEWFKLFWSTTQRREMVHYSPELIVILREKYHEELKSRAPVGWENELKLRAKIGPPGFIRTFAEKYREAHPEWIKKFRSPNSKYELDYYHPELVKKMTEASRLISKPPEGWMTDDEISREYSLAPKTVALIADKFRRSNPDWFHDYLNVRNTFSEHYHPDLVEHIVKILTARAEQKRHKENQVAIENKLEKFLSNVQKEDSAVGQHFRSLLKAFGSSRYLDVLYKFRPEFKGIPSEKVKGLLAEYLGDFLIARGKFDKDVVEAALEHLSDLSLREGLLETVKDDCFQFFLKERRMFDVKDPRVVLEKYREHARQELGHLDHPLFREVVEEAIAYYSDLYTKFQKPSGVIDALEAGRDFPDLNQLINIHELSEKKRMLIADEMGLGKSASVILAKESMGVHCALTIVPSNVIETWKRYLSDDGKLGGYFKPGNAPRVFVVERNEQLRGLSWDQYDYILISHEKLQGEYPELLKRIGYDMLIVDEAHKLKAPTGTRSTNLTELTKEAGEHGYLALLSGTPVPNKIEDVATLLKLLYPEKFKEIETKQLVYSIIKGDLVDLRSLLLPKMQRKRLEDGIEMPSLTENEHEVELTKLEKQVYEVLLEDDELLATEKMRVMRQFLLNPSLVDSTPGIESAKLQSLQGRLRSIFTESSRAIVFVNDYVEGVLRGPNSLLDQLALPHDVITRTVHGYTSREERIAIQQELANGSGKKMLVFVSGQTADVGVDFSSATHVLFYNEPWTEYQKRQELGRVYRPGLKRPLESDTFIAKGTIEQGMHEYIARKHNAIEKLLNGVPITELEQRMLIEAEKEETPDLSVSPELAQYYFSAWDKMMKMFGYVKELGEKRFQEFLKEHGSDYAEGYRELGNRSYQANANRLASALIEGFISDSKAIPTSLRVLDIASGPEMLRRHGSKIYRDQIISMDLNPEHFKKSKGPSVSGSWLNMPFKQGTFDYLNLSLSLHYTSYIPSKGKLERVKVLSEMNRVLKIGGRAVISLIYSYGLKHPELFRESVKELGFEVREASTGESTSGSFFRSYIITLEKKRDLDPNLTVDEINIRMSKEMRDGLKFKEIKGRLKDSRRILTGVEFNGRLLPIHLNEEDREAYVEEQQILKQGEELRDRHGDIRRIPPAEIVENGFVRIRSGKKYVLFKKLERGSGVVLVR